MKYKEIRRGRILVIPALPAVDCVRSLPTLPDVANMLYLAFGSVARSRASLDRPADVATAKAAINRYLRLARTLSK